MSVPVVAVVGRPNVGKSTLFNRFIGRRAAIVEERPGVTRDRKELLCDWLGREFRLLDTGGWMPGGSALDAKVSRQSERAMADADVIVFVVDGTIGVTDEDDRVAALLRRQSRPVIVAVNKIDSQQRENLIWEFMSFGLGEPHGISALHGLRTGDLLDAVVAALPPEDEGLRRPGARDADGDELGADNERGLADGDTEADDEVVAVALVGRPNVGKSTLFNRLIGEERSVVHDMPGTTRDTIDTIVETDIGRVRFVDTAGMRRKSKIDDGTEYYSAVRALQAVDKADVAVLVIDGGEGVTHQDQRLCERVDAAGCPILIALNKWETVDTETKEDVRRQVKDKLGFLGDVPVMGMSALSGKNVNRLLPALAEAVSAYRQRVPTRRVNEVIQKAQAEHPAPGGARVLYATQGAANPPTFTLFTNRDLHHTYLRFLENRLRDDLGLGRTPIKLRTRRRS